MITVLYDADCGVCRLTMLALMRLDWRGRLAPSPLQGYSEARPTRRELMETLHVRDESGVWTRGGDAASRIAATIPVLLPLAVLGRLPGARHVVDPMYRLVAGNRRTISRVLRLDACATRLRGVRPG